MRKRSIEVILGYPIYVGTRQTCIREIFETLDRQQGRARWLACFNPHSYKTAIGRPRFAQALRGADWLVPDGVGILHASWFLGGRISERITGSDIFRGVHEHMQARGGGRVFFLGSTEKTLKSIEARMAIDWPALTVAGSYSPPFTKSFEFDEISRIATAINSARPDVLWVGLTAPKQEELICKLLDRIDVRFIAAVGAVFDFYTGRIKRSPALFQSLGLEWLPRLMQEPRRLWPRIFVSAPVFVWHVVRERTGRDVRWR